MSVSMLSLIPAVSALMVIVAQPLTGMLWLIVRIFAPHWANTLSTAESSPVWSRSITWNVRMWPWRRS